MAQDQYVGIDLGTSNSAGAIFTRGRATVVPNLLGRMLTPSAVGLSLEREQELVIGDAALALQLQAPERVATEHKRSIGSPTAMALGDGS